MGPATGHRSDRIEPYDQLSTLTKFDYQGNQIELNYLSNTIIKFLIVNFFMRRYCKIRKHY